MNCKVWRVQNGACYCTKSYEQAYRWAGRKHGQGIVNVYSYVENEKLNIKKFENMCDECLEYERSESVNDDTME